MTSPTPIDPACLPVLRALAADPLALSEPALAHLRQCGTCSEARVLWLALQDFPEVEAAPGYFQGLGFRILRKLPSRPVSRRRSAALWLAAATLLGAAGLAGTGFYLGRAVRAPVVEAAQPRVPTEAPEPTETPFLETEDPLTQLSNLSPQEAEQALQRLQDAKPAAARP